MNNSLQNKSFTQKSKLPKNFGDGLKIMFLSLLFFIHSGSFLFAYTSHSSSKESQKIKVSEEAGCFKGGLFTFELLYDFVVFNSNMIHHQTDFETCGFTSPSYKSVNDFINYNKEYSSVVISSNDAGNLSDDSNKDKKEVSRKSLLQSSSKENVYNASSNDFLLIIHLIILIVLLFFLLAHAKIKEP